MAVLEMRVPDFIISAVQAGRPSKQVCSAKILKASKLTLSKVDQKSSK